ncbi:hypothetical protein [Aromatoleum aromaticum]|uniref:hypothetical protein n=1 Tax=Aromatoleum aromaticum TaxID=551760 RepID=UPI0002E06FB8|nr:hypothetical protein [Aromatoleum aromaticum]
MPNFFHLKVGTRLRLIVLIAFAERSSAEIRGSNASIARLRHSAEALEQLTAGFHIG